MGQRLYLVLGGELCDVSSRQFRNLKAIDFAGAFDTLDAAQKAWKSKAQTTVDNALMRYFILDGHRLLDPNQDQSLLNIDNQAEGTAPPVPSLADHDRGHGRDQITTALAAGLGTLCALAFARLMNWL